jgi:hypothetical protein
VGPATRFYHHPTSLPQPLALQRIQPPVHQVLQPPDLVPSAPGNSNDPTTTGPRSPSAKAATGTSKDPATTYYHWHFKGSNNSREYTTGPRKTGTSKDSANGNRLCAMYHHRTSFAQRYYDPHRTTSHQPLALQRIQDPGSRIRDPKWVPAAGGEAP